MHSSQFIQSFVIGYKWLSLQKQLKLVVTFCQILQNHSIYNRKNWRTIVESSYQL